MEKTGFLLFNFLNERETLSLAACPFFFVVLSRKLCIHCKLVHPKFDMFSFPFYREGQGCLSILVLFIFSREKKKVARKAQDLRQNFIIPFLEKEKGEETNPPPPQIH